MDAFFTRPFVEYKGAIEPKEIENKRKELELEANRLMSEGGKVCSYIW